MEHIEYTSRRGEIENYFDRTAAAAWERLTSDAPVGRIRATVRAGRDRMRATLLSWLPDDLSGRRIRISSATQSDWVSALGAIPVQTPFAEIVANVKRGNIDCAITGTMSGNTIGLHEVTSHLHSMPVNGGVAAFVANGGAWAALPRDLQDLLRRELPRLEQSIWDGSSTARLGYVPRHSILRLRPAVRCGRRRSRSLMQGFPCRR